MSTDANDTPDGVDPDAQPKADRPSPRYESAPVVRPQDRTGPPERPAQPGQPGREPEKVAEAEAQVADPDVPTPGVEEGDGGKIVPVDPDTTDNP